MKLIPSDYEVIFDTREQDIFIPSVLAGKGIKVKREKIDTGDYRIRCISNGYMPPVTVERKACIDELIGNMLDNRKDENGNNRFIREILRAKEQGFKLYLLIQDSNWYEKLIRGQYLSKVNSKAISGMITSLMAKYPWLHIVACNREISPSMVHKVLFYELREELKTRDADTNVGAVL